LAASVLAWKQGFPRWKVGAGSILLEKLEKLV
jgi:hypothetical protein